MRPDSEDARVVWKNEPFACILPLLGQRLAPQQGEPLHLDRSCAQPMGNQKGKIVSKSLDSLYVKSR